MIDDSEKVRKKKFKLERICHWLLKLSKTNGCEKTLSWAVNK